jgi:NagD protein
MAASDRPGTAYRGVQDIECWLTDMDGVLVRDNRAIPGAGELIRRWAETSTPFMVVTNNSIYTPRDLAARLGDTGFEVPEENIWTSALATAQFLTDQTHGLESGILVYTIGEAGLTTALHEAGFILTDQDPDFVVLGESRTYSFEAISTAIRLILAGARFIATNPDATRPSRAGPTPGNGARHRRSCGAHHQGHRPEALHRGRTEPHDVPLRHEPDKSARTNHSHHRGPDGHRHHRRHRSRAAHRAGPQRPYPQG